MRRHIATLAVLVALAALAAAGPAHAAVEPFGPLAGVVNAERCALGPSDTAIGADGIVHGFANFICGHDQQVVYFEGAGSRWSSWMAPYSGRVLSTAQDQTGTYLLYHATGGVR